MLSFKDFLEEENNPCWKGYKQVGTKKKNGKTVPNCVPEEPVNEDVSQKQISDLEKFADRLLNKFDVDIEFTRHFADRMNDSRNNPSISIAELQKLFKKIAKNKAKGIKANADSEAVLNDIQSDLNLPVVIKFNRKSEEFEVVNKTIMRKKDFKTSNTKIRYESVDYSMPVASDRKGPAKGKDMKSLSAKEHIAAMEWHEKERKKAKNMSQERNHDMYVNAHRKLASYKMDGNRSSQYYKEEMGAGAVAGAANAVGHGGVDMNPNGKNITKRDRRKKWDITQMFRRANGAYKK